jgi:mannosyltransferase
MSLPRTNLEQGGFRQRIERLEASLRVPLLAAFSGLIVFGCLLRFLKLTGVGFWYDELWTVVGASHRPFMEMYREWILGDAHPPGYFLFYFVWLKLVPPTELWARLPNAIAGVLTVAYLLFGTGRVLTRDERIMASLIASLSYIYIFYALSVKQYSAMVLFATIATISYLQMVSARRVDRRPAFVLTASCLALAYLNHFALVYAGLLLFLLAATVQRDEAARRRVLRMVSAFAIGYLPIAYFLYIQVRYAIDAWQPYDIRGFLSELLPWFFFNDSPFVSRGFVVLLAGVIAAVVWRQDARQLLASARNRHLLLVVLAFGGFMLALGLSKPIFFARYFLIMAPAVFLGFAVLMAAAFPLRSWMAILPLIFFVHGAAIQFRSVSELQREQWDKSVDVVLASKRPPDAVYVLGAKMDKTEFDYLQAGDVDDVFMVRNLKFYRYYFRRRGAEEMAAQLDVVEPTVDSARDLVSRFRQTGKTVYVLAGHRSQYDSDAMAALQRGARRIDVTRLYGTLIYRLAF